MKTDKTEIMTGNSNFEVKLMIAMNSKFYQFGGINGRELAAELRLCHQVEVSIIGLKISSSCQLN